MRQSTKDLNQLRNNDIIGILLYALWKLSDNPDYSALSELAFTLDKENLLKLCATFGGCTIKIPTLTELKNITKVLLILQYVNIDGMSFDEAYSLVGAEGDKKLVVKMYNVMADIVRDYYEEQ